jgi:drug/metabolite transporter (DMT)-like permease
MTRKDGLLALLVVVVWGLNFVVIKVGLHNMPPLMLAGLRFLLVAFRRCCLLPVLKSRCVCCSAMA